MTARKPLVVTIKATDLRLLLTTVLPFAGDPSGGMSVLKSVRIEGHGSCITACATNRYILGMQRIDTQAPKTLDAIVPVKAVKEMLALFKPRRGIPQIELTLTFTSDLVTIEAPDVQDMPSATWALISGKYPNVSGLIKGLDERPGDYVPSIDPKWLRIIISGLPKPVHLIPTAPGKAIIVRNDDGFLGAVMPLNQSEDFDARDLTEWAEVLGTKEKAV